MFGRLLKLLAPLAFLACWALPALASQDSCVLPTSGTQSGLTVVTNINNCFGAQLTMQSAATAPSSPSTGMMWRDTSTTPQAIKQYDGTSWNVIWWLDTANHLTVPPVGGGNDTIASGTTTDLWSKPQFALTVSGTTAITQLANASATTGALKLITFSSALTLTYDATKLILPSAANITTAAGDYALVLARTSTNVTVVQYFRADGTAVNQSSNFLGAVFFNNIISPAALVANTNDWNPAGLSTANEIRFSCSSTINITGLTAPATDGKVIILHNIGTSNGCRFTNQDTNSTAANRFILTAEFILYPLESQTFIYDNTTARWRLQAPPRPQSIAGRYKNLRVTNVANWFGDTAPGTPNNQIKGLVDEIVLEDSAGITVRRTSLNCTADVTVSGAGGLDTGSVSTGTWYSYWFIFNPATATDSCLFSTSATAPTMPSGYTYKARVSWNRTDASSRFYRRTQYNDRNQAVPTSGAPNTALLNIASGIAGTYSTTTPTWAAASVSTFVPTTAASIFIVIVNAYSGNPTAEVLLAPNNQYTGVAGNSQAPGIVRGSGGESKTIEIVLEASSVQWVSNTAGGAILEYGWRDNL